MALVAVDVMNSVRIIRVNDLVSLESLRAQALNELRELIESAAHDPEVDALVISGLDAGELAGTGWFDVLLWDVDYPISARKRHLWSLYRLLAVIRDLSVVTVAAVDGPVFNVGLTIAQHCTTVVAGPKTRVGATFAEVGTDANIEMSWLLRGGTRTGRTSRAARVGNHSDVRRSHGFGRDEVITDEVHITASLVARLQASRPSGQGERISRQMKILETSRSPTPTSLGFERWSQAELLGRDRFARFLNEPCEDSS